MHDVDMTQPRGGVRGVVWAVLMALLAPLAVLIAAAPAAAAESCDIGPERVCVLVRLPSGIEIPGIKATITTPDGASEEVETTDDGTVWFESTQEGDYTVALVTDSLPDGVELQANAETTITRTAALGGQVITLFNVRADDYKAAGSSGDRFAQSLVSGIRLGLLLALAAVGLSLIYGTTGLSSFSHAEQVTLGGVTAYLLANVAGLPFLLAAALTVVICGFTGYLQDRIVWQPLRRRGIGLIQMMIVTIGLSLALQYLFQILIGARSVRVITASPETVQIGPVVLTEQSYYAMAVAVICLVGVGYALLRTRLGRATRAVSDNPALAAASGIDVDRVIRIVWIMSTALAGLAGIMLALVLNGVKWDSGMQILLLLFAAVTLGGLGTAFGALVGSMIIGLVVELTPVFGLPGDLKYATALLILILLLLVRPQGLLGKAQRVG